MGVRARVLVTAAGAVTEVVGGPWPDTRGWCTEAAAIAPLAAEATVLAWSAAAPARNARAMPFDTIVLGVDLASADHPRAPNVQFAVVLDLRSGRARAIAKSYPTCGEAAALVREPRLARHLISLDGERTLVLVCHDLNMFHPRGRAASARAEGPRWRAWTEADALVRVRAPTTVLHLAHWTETARVWRSGWRGVARALPGATTWATGIRGAFEPMKGDLLAATARGDVIDLQI